MKKKLRILIVLVSVFILTFSSCLTASASDAVVVDNYANMTESEWHTFIQSIKKDNAPIIDKQPFYLASVAGDGIYHILYSTKVFKYSDGYIYSSPQESGEYGVEVQYVSYDSNTDTVSILNGYYLGPSWQFTNISSDVFISNHNITYLGLNDVFFHWAPLGVVAEVARTVSLKETLTSLVGLVPLLIVFLILVVAFYKAWKFFSQILRSS